MSKRRNKEIAITTKAAILHACAKLTDPITGDFAHGGRMQVLRQFPSVSLSSIIRIHRLGKGSPLAIKLDSSRVGRCGRESKLTPELKEHYMEVAQEYANEWIRLTRRLAQVELEDRGFHLSTRTIGKHFSLMNAKTKNLAIKPALSPSHKEAWMGRFT